MVRSGIIVLLMLLILVGCGGSLSEKQRKAFKEEMKDREIKKLSEEEIYKQALDDGQSLMAQLVNGSTVEQAAHKCGCEISFIENENQELSKVERNLFEAYQYNPKGADNIQKEDDWLIYSKPVLEGDSLRGVWFIKLPKKGIVKEL